MSYSWQKTYYLSHLAQIFSLPERWTRTSSETNCIQKCTSNMWDTRNRHVIAICHAYLVRNDSTYQLEGPSLGHKNTYLSHPELSFDFFDLKTCENNHWFLERQSWFYKKVGESADIRHFRSPRHSMDIKAHPFKMAAYVQVSDLQSKINSPSSLIDPSSQAKPLVHFSKHLCINSSISQRSCF